MKLELKFHDSDFDETGNYTVYKDNNGIMYKVYEDNTILKEDSKGFYTIPVNSDKVEYID